MRVSQLLLIAAAGTAVFEMDLMISLILFAVGFVDCIVSGYIQASAHDVLYEPTVVDYREANAPSNPVVLLYR
jgi:hypothetical protein